LQVHIASSDVPRGSAVVNVGLLGSLPKSSLSLIGKKPIFTNISPRDRRADASRLADHAVKGVSSMDAMSETAKEELSFAFGPYRLVPGRQLLLLDDQPAKLGGGAFEVLNLLVQRSGQLVTKDELIAAAWPGTFARYNAVVRLDGDEGLKVPAPRSIPSAA
jgi:hypothetical protein